MSRGGARAKADVPERRCIATGTSGPKAGLIRFVVGPGEQIVPDLAEKLPGRGIWVSADRAVLEKAVKKNLFPRGAKKAVATDAGLADLVTERLVARVIEALSLARKAGQAVAGLEKVKDLLIKEEATCLLQARDGSEREKRRLRPPEGENTYFDVLSAQEMGLAFGQDRVIHTALIAGGLGELVRYESARLRGLRPDQG
ncbi:MAG: RNA-binding protein [Pseudomonadota bacterium]